MNEGFTIKILSFDQSTTVTGWCLFKDDNYITHDVINLKQFKGSSFERIREMQMLIHDVINSFSPDVVVIEDTVLQRNPQTLKDLSQLQGVIIGICRGNNIKCEIIFPSSWRKLLKFKQGSGIKRSQLKQQAKDYVFDTYGVKPSEDECEAICIGNAYIKTTNLNMQ